MNTTATAAPATDFYDDDEPWCQHDAATRPMGVEAPTVIDGVCECGAREVDGAWCCDGSDHA